jgi:hypothetical protein
MSKPDELTALRNQIIQARLERLAGHPEEATPKEVAALVGFVQAMDDANPTLKTVDGILLVASAHEELASAVYDAIMAQQSKKPEKDPACYHCKDTGKTVSGRGWF